MLLQASRPQLTSGHSVVGFQGSSGGCPKSGRRGCAAHRRSRRCYARGLSALLRATQGWLSRQVKRSGIGNYEPPRGEQAEVESESGDWIWEVKLGSQFSHSTSYMKICTWYSNLRICFHPIRGSRTFQASSGKARAKAGSRKWSSIKAANSSLCTSRVQKAPFIWQGAQLFFVANIVSFVRARRATWANVTSTTSSKVLSTKRPLRFHDLAPADAGAIRRLGLYGQLLVQALQRESPDLEFQVGMRFRRGSSRQFAAHLVSSDLVAPDPTDLTQQHFLDFTSGPESFLPLERLADCIEQGVQLPQPKAQHAATSAETAKKDWEELFQHCLRPNFACELLRILDVIAVASSLGTACAS